MRITKLFFKCVVLALFFLIFIINNGLGNLAEAGNKNCRLVEVGKIYEFHASPSDPPSAPDLVVVHKKNKQHGCLLWITIFASNRQDRNGNPIYRHFYTGWFNPINITSVWKEPPKLSNDQRFISELKRDTREPLINGSVWHVWVSKESQENYKNFTDNFIGQIHNISFSRGRIKEITFLALNEFTRDHYEITLPLQNISLMRFFKPRPVYN